MTNGITLRADYGPYIVTAISPTQHFYTDTALSSAVTLPATISATTTWYCAPAYSNFYTFTCTQVDGSDISPGVPQWVGTTADSTLNPRPSWAQISSDIMPARRRTYLSGYYYSADGESRSAGAAGTGVMTCIPFYVWQPFTADRIGVGVSSGAASAVIRLGIYANSTSDKPSTLVLDAGTVDGSSTANVEATISFAFARGLYWLAAASQTASATLRTITSGLPPVAASSLSTGVGSAALNCYYLTGITGAFADVASPSAGGAGYLVSVRAV